MHKTKNITPAVVVILIGIVCIGAGIAILIMGKTVVTTRTEMYVVAGLEGKYGVYTAEGKVVVQPIYTNIIAGKDVMYLRSDSGSMLYNPETKTKVQLNGSETNIVFPKNKDGEYIDKYILKYGTGEQGEIYRIIDTKGERISSKDYTSLLEAGNSIGAITDNLENVVFDDIILGGNKVVNILPYVTLEGKDQYIVKDEKEPDNFYGIMDENSKVIASIEYNSIEIGKGKNTAVIAKKDDRVFVIPVSGVPVEIDMGFEADIENEGYIIQKKGATANKLYNLKGEALIDDIFDYPIETITINSKTTSYLFIKAGEATWAMYDLEDVKTPPRRYSNINIDCFKNKKLSETSTSFMYKKLGANYVVDLDTFSEFKLGIEGAVVALLEPGYILNPTN